MMKTTNNGNNWYLLTLPIDDIQSIFFTNQDTGYAGHYQGLLISTNSGIDWSNNSLGYPFLTLSSIVFLNNNTGYLSLTTPNGGAGGTFKTTNSGINWMGQGGGGDCISFPGANTGYSVGTFGRIYKTSNSGDTWSIQNSGTARHLWSISFIDQNTGWAVGDTGIILKTTNGGGPIGITPISQNIPDNFKLFQNYPNPFNPVTNIHFTVPKRALVNLYIYDAAGRLVDSPLNSILDAGTYSVDWEGNNNSSGIYFYRLVTDNYSETKKMVLVK